MNDNANELNFDLNRSFQQNMLEEDYEDSKACLVIILLFAFSLIYLDIISIIESFTGLTDMSKKTSPIVFDFCYRSHIITEIFFTVFATLAGISAIIIVLFLFIEDQEISKRLVGSVANFNFYIFGPLLLCVSALGFYNYKTVCFECYDNDYKNMSFDFITAVCLLVSFVISSSVTFTINYIDTFEKMCESVKLTRDGNGLIGRVFWDIVLSRNGSEHNNLESNNLDNNLLPPVEGML